MSRQGRSEEIEREGEREKEETPQQMNAQQGWPGQVQA